MPATPQPGAKAPDLDIDLIIGSKWRLKDQSPDAFTMIVFYRGLHCPKCKEYLGALREHYDALLDLGIQVIHVSMDDKDRAEKAHDDWGLDPVPMAYGLTEEQARDWGLYISQSIKDAEPDRFAEPGLFLVRPDGELYLADVSNSPFSRPDIGTLIKGLRFVVEKDYPTRGTEAA